MSATDHEAEAECTCPVEWWDVARQWNAPGGVHLTPCPVSTSRATATVELQRPGAFKRLPEPCRWLGPFGARCGLRYAHQMHYLRAAADTAEQQS